MKKYYRQYISFLLIQILTVSLIYAQKTQNYTYQGNQLQSLRIPVGGIGAGNILIGGRGNIEFIEVFNRPNRQRKLEKTFFSLWMQESGNEPVVKLLEREVFPPYLDVSHKYGGGLPRMQEVTFTNRYPHLHWQYNDEKVPLDISLEILNPMIPLDFEASSYPACKFNWTISNPTKNKIEGSIALSMENPIEADSILNRYLETEGYNGIQFISSGNNVPVNYRGGMIIATPIKDDVEVQTHWYPGTWRDEAHIFWDDFMDDGHIEVKKGDWQTSYAPTSYNKSTKRMATILVPFSLEAGEELTIPYYLSWYFPERAFTAAEVFGIEEAQGKPFKNHYANRFKSDIDVLDKFLQAEKELTTKTKAFVETLHRSSFPEYVIEALNTQVATLASPLLQVTGEGNVHGFEGVLDNSWCCAGSCTHVWNYEQTLASLYPSLERKMREIEFLHNTFDDGFQTHRAVIPLGNYWFNGPAAADGQMGTIVRAYREWKLSGDDQWLSKLWPKIKLALEFAWYGSGAPAKEKTGNQQEAWDPDQIGILSGKQHNTYDINFYGPTSMTTSLYLAALKAGSEMAKAMGERKKAKEYHRIYENGASLMQDSLWNGDYFIQIIAGDPSLKEENLSPTDQQGQRIPKYQYGDGCLADQLLGQYLAFISGLGYIADKEKVNKALLAVYENNFIKDLREFSNVQRVYGLNDEAGVVLSTWPHDNRPSLPFVYADEMWTGVEYQVAASLIYAGKVNEGLEILEAVHNRYDGYKRNPFEHIESGVHYARALSSWSILLALSGVEYDGITKTLSFAPKINSSDFQSFWSTSTAWGEVFINENEIKIKVIHGDLHLERLSVQDPGNKQMKTRKYKKGNIVMEGEMVILSFADMSNKE